MFATMDLTTPLADGVTLAVGVRNSIDKSLPLGFCAGSRVFVCDNLSFRSELMVHRKHTRFGQSRFEEEIARPCSRSSSSGRRRSAASPGCGRRRSRTRPPSRSCSGRYERGIVSHRLLPQVIREWRQPRFRGVPASHSLGDLQCVHFRTGSAPEDEPATLRGPHDPPGRAAWEATAPPSPLLPSPARRRQAQTERRTVPAGS